jgi:uncharacterized protein YerC
MDQLTRVIYRHSSQHYALTRILTQIRTYTHTQTYTHIQAHTSTYKHIHVIHLHTHSEYGSVNKSHIQTLKYTRYALTRILTQIRTYKHIQAHTSTYT